MALRLRYSSLVASIGFGFAGGALVGTITLEMIPRALELGSPGLVAGGFACGFLAVYAFDLWMHRGRIAGWRAEQRPAVERFYRKRRPRGGEATVLAGGTSAEELVEGLAIGVGAGVETKLGLLVGLSILLDNLAEGLSVGEFLRAESPGRDPRLARRVLGWTGLIGAAVLGSTLVGFFVLGDLAAEVLAFLLAVGGAGMLYLTVTDLVPEGQERSYEQSAALAAGAGFVMILALSSAA